MAGITAAVLQTDAVSGDLSGNLCRAEQLVCQAVGRGASLAVLPELFAFGYHPERVGRDPTGQEETLDWITGLSRKLGICLAGGFPEQREGLFYDSLAVSCRGDLTVYRKMHLFLPAGEGEVFTAGDTPVTVEWEGLKIGLSICFDLRFPALYRYYRDAGCQAVIVSAAFPFPRQEHWRILLRSRAIENQFFMAASNRCGTSGSLTFCGGSAVVDPSGTELDRCGARDPGLACAEIDPAVVSRARETLPCRLSPFFGQNDTF